VSRRPKTLAARSQGRIPGRTATTSMIKPSARHWRRSRCISESSRARSCGMYRIVTSNGLHHGQQGINGFEKSSERCGSICKCRRHRPKNRRVSRRCHSTTPWIANISRSLASRNPHPMVRAAGLPRRQARTRILRRRPQRRERNPLRSAKGPRGDARSMWPAHAATMKSETIEAYRAGWQVISYRPATAAGTRSVRRSRHQLRPG
jgi:hypothetical protein